MNEMYEMIKGFHDIGLSHAEVSERIVYAITWGHSVDWFLKHRNEIEHWCFVFYGKGIFE